MTTKTRREIQKFAEQHIGLVRKIAHQIKFKCETETFDDLVSIGTIGLMKAVEKFDDSQGSAFSSLAVPYIRGEILHYLRDAKGELIRHRRGEQRQFINSLDAPLSHDSETTLLETIANTTATIETQDSEAVAQLSTLLNRLTYPYREVLILIELNGLLNKEAAEWFEVSPVTITRWLANAQQQLQQLKDQPEKFKTKTYKRDRNALPYRDELKQLHVPEIKRRCEVCDRVFGLWEKAYCIAKSNIPKTCSSVCARKLSGQSNPNFNGWSDLEIKFLKDRIGKMPTIKIIEEFQKRWTHRTNTALKVKLKRIAKSLKCTDDGWSMRDLARLLDIPADRVRVWKKRGLKMDKIPRATVGQCVIYRKDLHEFCTEQYWRFSGIDVEKLTEVLQDRALAEKCATQPLRKKRVEVQHLGSKRVYRSAREAAREMGVDRQFVLREIKRKDTALMKQSHVETVGLATLPIKSLHERRDERSVIDPSLPMNIRRLRHPDGRIYETNNLSLFANIHDLTDSLLSQLCLGRQGTHKGWRFIDFSDRQSRYTSQLNQKTAARKRLDEPEPKQVNFLHEPKTWEDFAKLFDLLVPVEIGQL
jgi:RNA polymerase sigma-B factor